MDIPKQFRLPFSKGSEWICSYLLKYSSKLPKSEALRVSKKLLKKIEKINAELEKSGIPSHLYLSYVNAKVNFGIFLKPDASPIDAGDLIGIYTGHYELVESDITVGTSYAYDVAQEVKIPKKDQHRVLNRSADYKKNEYSIQTNALEMGNFTRYINHSSLCPNVEAIVSKFPDGRIEILLFALTNIYPGEQLLSCYGGQYWKALEVIPNDMAPDTYLLNKSLKLKLANPIRPLSPSHYKFLLPLRNVLVHMTESAEKHFCKILSKKLPSLSNAQREEIDEFENEVLERGIPRVWKLPLKIGSTLNVCLDKKGKKIPKGTCIGVLSGTFSTVPSSRSCLIANKNNKSLYLDTSKESNFLSLIPVGKKSNVKWVLTFDSEENTPLLLAIVSKTISPGDKLSFEEIKPLILEE